MGQSMARFSCAQNNHYICIQGKQVSSAWKRYVSSHASNISMTMIVRYMLYVHHILLVYYYIYRVYVP